MTTPLLYEGGAVVPAFDDVPTTEQLLRTKEIPWDIYMTARLISDQDLQLLRRYDKRDAAQRTVLLGEAGPSYVAALLAVLKNVTKDETVQYVLALLDDMLAADPSRAALFHQLSSADAPAGPGGDAVVGGPLDPYAILLRLLQCNDWFTEEKAALVLAAVLAARPDKEALARALSDGAAQRDVVAKTVSSFLDWIVGQLRRPSHPALGVPTAVHCLSMLLREPAARPLVLRASVPPLLAPFIAMPAPGAQINIQLLYESIVCCWELSFHKPAAEALASTGVVGGLVDVVRLAQKEKLVRVALLALRNLLSGGASLALEFAVVEKGLPKAVEHRMAQNWDDADVPALLEWMSEHLEEGVLALTSLERYRTEVASGQLMWSPLHESDAFWAEHGERLMDGNCALLRSLLGLVESSRDPTTLAVACRDVGQFATVCPHGRSAVAQLRGKGLIMALMAHPDPQVQREALLCVQRLLLSRDKADFLMAA